MRVVCPYTGLLRSETVASLHLFAPSFEFIEVDTGRRDSYWQILDDLWAAGEAFLVVEHDIEIHAGVVGELDSCPEPWCVYPYMGPSGELLTNALGCTRFSAELLAVEPDLFRVTGEVSDGLPPKDWRRVDTILFDHLRTAGYVSHQHGPPVIHHHPY